MALTDHQGEIFGRRQDVANLIERASEPGFTAIVARPQAGKTWTLESVGHHLAQNNHLVGYYEITADEEPITRVLVDLYTRWLSSASFVDQGLSLYERHKDSLITKTGQAIGRLVEKSTKLLKDATQIPLDTAGKIVRETFDGLAAADQDLKTAGIQMAPLTIEVVKELLAQLHKLSGQNAVLILDAWEKSRTIDNDRDTLTHWLKHFQEWPHLLVYAGVRRPDPDDPDRGDEGVKAAETLKKASTRAQVYPLEPMDLEDAKEKSDLLAHVRARFPAAEGVTDEILLQMIGGEKQEEHEYFAGVIGRWREAPKDNITTADGLKEIALEAQDYRYGELEPLFDALEGDARKLAIRLALLPRMNTDWWETIQEAVFSGCDADVLCDLEDSGLLLPINAQGFPTFGHDTRHTAAQRQVVSQLTVPAGRELDALVLAIAASVDDDQDRQYLCLLALVILSEQEAHLPRTVLTLEYLNAAGNLFKIPLPVDISLLTSQPEIDHTAAFVSVVCFSLLYRAQRENDLIYRNELFEALRRLAGQRPDDTAVRAQWAKALFNMLCDESDEGGWNNRDALLETLCGLAEKYPDDSVVREAWASALANTQLDAIISGDLKRSDVFFDELRRLAETYPDDAAVREQWARALFNTQNEGDSNRRDALFMALRRLAEHHPDDTAVRAKWAKALVNTQLDAIISGDLKRRDAFFETLRRLADTYPDHATVREQWARALFNMSVYAYDEGDWRRREEAFETLRFLAVAYPDDAAVRENWARALVNRLDDAKFAGYLQHRDEVFKMLCGLAEAYPCDSAVRKLWARSLFNTLVDAHEEHDLKLRDAVFETLRRLADVYPDDFAVREKWARALLNMLTVATDMNGRNCRNALLETLRRLTEKYPDDAVVREEWAKGLFNTLNAAKDEGDLKRRDEVFEVLRGLTEAHPDDAAVRKVWGRALWTRRMRIIASWLSS